MFVNREKMLKGTKYGIQEKFPYEIEERLKPLYPLLRSARRNRQTAILVRTNYTSMARSFSISYWDPDGDNSSIVQPMKRIL